MFVLRPIEKSDLDSLYNLATTASTGITTLPADKDLLNSRIEESLISFSKTPSKPGGEYYLFVLEDLEKKKVIGTSGIFSKVGGYEPFYTYELKKSLHESKSLNVSNEVEYLQLLAIHDGPSEIGTLFLMPEYRGKGLGRLLSLGRFMFMGEFPDRFENEILAELRGVIDKNETSPFWESLGRHFFQVDYPKADAMVMKGKRFIADLMPIHPIYIPLLTQEARDVLGKVHKNTLGALKLLESEGFEYRNQLDIFEAGPVLHCKVSKVRTIKESQKMEIREITSEPIDSLPFMISSCHESLYITTGNLSINPGKGLRISQEIADTLNVKIGEKLRFSPLNVKGSGK